MRGTSREKDSPGPITLPSGLVAKIRTVCTERVSADRCGQPTRIDRERPVLHAPRRVTASARYAQQLPEHR